MTADPNPRNCILSGDKPHPLQSHELQTCTRCVGRTRADLYAVVDAYALLPSLLGLLGTNHIRVAGGESRLPGGDILVMLGPGSPAMARLRAELAGRDVWDIDDQPDDPASIAYELGRWEDDWRHTRGEPAAAAPMSVAGAFGYLRSRVDWAAQWHMAFDEFADDLRKLRNRAEVAAGLDNTPVRAAVACFGCGQRGLIRRYLDKTGLEDDWQCHVCWRRYDQASYFLAVRAMLEERSA